MLCKLLSSPCHEKQRKSGSRKVLGFTKSSLSLDYAHSRDEVFKSTFSVVNPENRLSIAIGLAK